MTALATLGRVRDSLRAATVRQLHDGIYATTMAREEIRLTVRDRKELRRAEDLIGEVPVLDWLMAGVDDATLVWDVGAYQGHYSLVAAARGADVLAFEPVTANRERIATHADLNDVDIDRWDVALSDATQTLHFDSGGPDSEGQIDDAGDRTVEAVRGGQISPPPDVLKIDVEGHECAVLDGLGSHLDQARRVTVEVHDDADVGAVRSRLHRAGLEVFEIPVDRSQTFLGGYR